VKAIKWNEKGKLSPHVVAYCISLQNALISLFQQMIVENCKHKEYTPTIKDLSKTIQNAKQEFDAMLTPDILKELKHVKN
jgi:hypothetical protein